MTDSGGKVLSGAKDFNEESSHDFLRPIQVDNEREGVSVPCHHNVGQDNEPVSSVRDIIAGVFSANFSY